MTPDDVLRLCIGDEVADAVAARAVISRWFTVDPEFDASLRARFTDLVEQALAGDLHHWCADPRGALAFIMVCDQLPRNIFRGLARAFAGDGLARGVALDGLARGWDRDLALLERIFFCLPFEHAEDLDLQRRYVSYCEDLHAEAPPAFRSITGDALKAAREHHDIIERFGRFPHRNAALGREPTAEEAAWYAGHGRGWGQGFADQKP